MGHNGRVLTRDEALALTGDEEVPAQVDVAWQRATEEGRMVEFVDRPGDLLDAVAEGLPSLDDDHLDRLANAVAAETERRAHLTSR